jgi:hypothetical protein
MNVLIIKFKSKVLLATLIGCVFACSPRGDNLSVSIVDVNGHKIAVISLDNLKPEPVTVPLSSLLENLSFVQLETKEDAFFRPWFTTITDNYIGVINHSGSYKLFDRSGKFLCNVGSNGQGPGEYAQLDFFDIDRESRHIVLSDLTNYWVMRYDLDGKFLFRQKIPVWCYGVSVLPNNGIVLFAAFSNNSTKLTQEYNLFFLDSCMNIQKSFFPYNSRDLNPRIVPSVSQGGHFYTFEDNLYFAFPDGSMIYQITADSVLIKYQFDFGKRVLHVENPQSDPNLFTERLSQRNYNGLYAPIVENDQLLNFCMKTTQTPLLYYVFYSKSSGNVIASYSFAIEQICCMGNILSGYDSWIVYSDWDTETIVNWRETFPKDQISTAGKFTKARLAFAEELTEDDNPVLMFFKLKPF